MAVAKRLQRGDECCKKKQCRPRCCMNGTAESVCGLVGRSLRFGIGDEMC
ncbi:hypothetical protein [Prevotellamassilia timonensis]|nr:hypothetical protein [Prevotellamassilia timonensis]MCF2635679.1 hypothetical protein [Prevotellamassilia timonensis]